MHAQQVILVCIGNEKISAKKGMSFICGCMAVVPKKSVCLAGRYLHMHLFPSTIMCKDPWRLIYGQISRLQLWPYRNGDSIRQTTLRHGLLQSGDATSGDAISVRNLLFLTPWNDWLVIILYCRSYICSLAALGKMNHCLQHRALLHGDALCRFSSADISAA